MVPLDEGDDGDDDVVYDGDDAETAMSRRATMMDPMIVTNMTVRRPCQAFHEEEDTGMMKMKNRGWHWCCRW